MSGSTLDYIILAIIFTIVIYLFIKTIKSTECVRNEYMDNLLNSTIIETPYLEQSDAELNKSLTSDSLSKESPSLMSNLSVPDVQTTYSLPLQEQSVQSVQSVQSEDPSFFIKLPSETQKPDNKLPFFPALASEYVQETVETKKNVCMLDDIDITNDRYIREFVLGGKYTCFEKTDLKPEQVQDYQDNFFKFNENINYNSNAGVNTVDKLNELNNTINGYYGMKMSDVYNELTGTCVAKKSSCVNENCLIPPKLDAQFKGGYYVDETPAGKYMTKYNFRYEDDDVINGGKFYDNIEASDDDFESNMAI